MNSETEGLPERAGLEDVFVGAAVTGVAAGLVWVAARAVAGMAASDWPTTILWGAAVVFLSAVSASWLQVIGRGARLIAWERRRRRKA